MLHRALLALSLFSLVALLPAADAADGPVLPGGLEEDAGESGTGPALPGGLDGGDGGAGDGPALPGGLGDGAEADGPAEADAPVSIRDRLPFDLSGFVEARAGGRTGGDPYQDEVSLAETRLRLELQKSFEPVTVNLKFDLLGDAVADGHDVDLEDGTGWFDLREFHVVTRPVDFMDLKVGRQVLTWGTGDLLFINDNFPKDWQSFFVGRDVEYLKAPSDAVKASLFFDAANLDLVYAPRFDSDRYISGERISFWHGGLQRQAGEANAIAVDKPDDWFEEDEVALRLYRNFGGFTAAAYAYEGYWKSPAGSDPATGLYTFPGLEIYGASLRGPVGDGILSLETGYYYSDDDPDGDDPMVRNSEWRFLAGYEAEIAKNLTLGGQYYAEWMQDHDEYLQGLRPGTPASDEVRHVLTMRLTKRLMQQNLTLELFTYYSPSDEDAYLRPRIHYKVDDHWSWEIGGNIFAGDEPHTFFGQFDHNTNAYAAIRYSF